MDELLERAAPYLKILERDDTDLPALTALGMLLYTGGRLVAGRRALARAAGLHPGDSLARVNFGNVLLDQGDLPEARAEFEAALAVDPTFASAHRGLAILFAREGNAIAVRRHARLLRDLPLPVGGCRGVAPLRMLLLVSAIGGNVDLQGLIDDEVFERHTLIVELCDASMALPDVDVVFNAIGDADRCADVLERAMQVVSRVGVRIVNDPSAVRATGRAENARRLMEVRGVVAPPTVAMTRAELLAPTAREALLARGIVPPFLLRSAGFHTGKNVAKIDRFDQLAQALAGLPGERFFAIAFVDLHDADGMFVKYRVMVVGGELFALHCATSPDWNVHYYTAGMEASPQRRARDEAFLSDMWAVLGARAMGTLHAICEKLDLDYGGIDFALDERGDVVVFEANATMVVPAPTDDPRFAYRNPAGVRVVTAVHRMLSARARATTH